MVRYYGYYSNVFRGKRGKLNLDEAIPCILMSEEGAKKYRKNWGRLIQKIGAWPRLDRGRRTPCPAPKLVLNLIQDVREG
jgi:hypothetical protein